MPENNKQMFVIFHFNICLKRFNMPPTTRKQTPFNDAFVAKKYTRTKLPTSIELYCQYLEFNSNSKQTIQDLRLIWEEAGIPNVPFTSIHIKFTRFLTNIRALSKFSRKQNFEMKKKNSLRNITSYSILHRVAVIVNLKIHAQ